jgi:hypothetical protein
MEEKLCRCGKPASQHAPFTRADFDKYVEEQAKVIADSVDRDIVESVLRELKSQSDDYTVT